MATCRSKLGLQADSGWGVTKGEFGAILSDRGPGSDLQHYKEREKGKGVS